MYQPTLRICIKDLERYTIRETMLLLGLICLAVSLFGVWALLN